jgi:hypothetical protein
LYYLRLEIEIISGAADFDEAVGRICFLLARWSALSPTR